ncbi:MAG: tripartite tricarboxylate transporter TctB family protein [Pseudolabrys sp.]
MSLRADHVAGATFILFGILVIALSGDLPAGRLSMPGAGFLPLIVAVLLIGFGGALLLRAAEGPAFSAIDWSDLPHALKVLGVAAAAVALYTNLGFIITLVAMMVALLVFVERKSIVHAAVYSAGVVAITFVTFEFVLKTPLPNGPLGY